jgi:DnaJ-class molecular chaperone
MHPDKLKQKGIQVTPEHNEQVRDRSQITINTHILYLQFNRLKEAYEVLTDNRKRRIYDQ